MLKQVSLIFVLLFVSISTLFSQSPYGKVLTLDSNGTQQWINLVEVLYNLMGGDLFGLPDGSSVAGKQSWETTSDKPFVLKTSNEVGPRIVNIGGTTSIIGGSSGSWTKSYSMAIGAGLETRSYGEIVIGLYSDNSGYSGNLISYQSNDRLFVIGNGQSSSSRSNALVMLKNGNTAIGHSSPTSLLDLQSTNGYQQLRLRTSYTPTGTADTNGNVGDVCWDGNYIYIKTSSGWKRAALSTW